MCKAHDHTIHGAQHHFGWDHSIPPVLTVAPGTTIEFECLDASGGQLTKDSTLADVGATDPAPELAEARDKLWTPDKEKPEGETKLWTPGSKET